MAKRPSKRKFDDFVRDTFGRRARGEKDPTNKRKRPAAKKERRAAKKAEATTTRAPKGSTSSGSVGVPSNPVTGATRDAGYSGAGILGTVRDTPTALINDALKARGLGLYGGAGDLLSSIASPDQLDTLYALSAAGKNSFGGSPSDQGNYFINFYN